MVKAIFAILIIGALCIAQAPGTYTPNGFTLVSSDWSSMAAATVQPSGVSGLSVSGNGGGLSMSTSQYNPGPKFIAWGQNGVTRLGDNGFDSVGSRTPFTGSIPCTKPDGTQQTCQVLNGVIVN